ncbi:putative calmodulin-like protein 6 [Tetrabaena socialis]|uniref:Putative calmodulin-like protein 6 n=1 Tax=Tetrabaena socialis TaxID=47790 RepID=A0A2J8ACE0_9CHLO|nr:putative calmodulin-like protein 6 [Tetrabaena socialis]|eukprot:PNH10163.1 putative calmodulin-like protein 6 [Tetrabaena socialis]
MQSTAKVPFTEPEWKIPGYTGYVQGLQETYKKTPIMAQLETKDPTPESFIFTRTQTKPKPSPVRDPCNDPENFKKPQPGNLWPALQDTAIQASFKPPTSNIALGDERIVPFRTSYGVDFKAPFDGQEQLRSPNRNEDLVKTTSSLINIYKSSFNRVGEKRLQKMISTMRERMEAKLGNSNNNAFRMRKLFKMYDNTDTGRVHFEDFRNMAETFGMQLDDDSLMALYFVYDREGTGYLEYDALVAQLMSPSDFAFYKGYVDYSQDKADESRRVELLGQLKKKMGPVSADLEGLLKTFDKSNNGLISRPDLVAGCASVGVVLSDKDFDTLAPVMTTSADGLIDYVAFCSVFLS